MISPSYVRVPRRNGCTLFGRIRGPKGISTSRARLTRDALPSPAIAGVFMRSSPEARRTITNRSVKGLLSVRSRFLCFVVYVIWLFVCSTTVLAQGGSQSNPAASPATSPAPQSENKQNPEELASRDEPATFKVNVKLVVVRAVVRDSQGHAVGNLRQEDFQVFDKGKPQVISQFEVEQPGTLAAKVRRESVENSGDSLAADTSPTTGIAPPVPERFVAYLFDDVHLEFGDLARVREAAERHFASLRPTDRAAIFSTSGQTILDFTDDRTQLHATLLRLQPRPIARGFGETCPDISYYQADLIINRNDPLATQVAIADAIACSPPPPNNSAAAALQMATALVQGASPGVLSAGDHESRIALGLLSDVVRNVSRKPGQRSVVLVSPGFITPQLEYEYTDIIDRAVRWQVVINTLDARGLYVPTSLVDASRSNPPPPGKALIEVAAA